MNLSKSKKIQYFIDSDNDGHWYLVPYNIQKQWNEWLDLDPDDEKSWEPPKPVVPIDGVDSIVFENPEEREYDV